MKTKNLFTLIVLLAGLCHTSPSLGQDNSLPTEGKFVGQVKVVSIKGVVQKLDTPVKCTFEVLKHSEANRFNFYILNTDLENINYSFIIDSKIQPSIWTDIINTNPNSYSSILVESLESQNQIYSYNIIDTNINNNTISESFYHALYRFIVFDNPASQIFTRTTLKLVNSGQNITNLKFSYSEVEEGRYLKNAIRIFVNDNGQDESYEILPNKLALKNEVIVDCQDLIRISK